MAPSSVSFDKLAPAAKRVLYDHDPGGTSATIVTPDGGTTERIWDMREFECFGVLAMSTVLAGNGITKVEIVASDSADMSTNLTVVKDSGTIAADAVGDQAWLECHQSELAQLSTDNAISPGLRYVAARITCQNAGDEAVVLYEGKPKRPRDGLTPATTIA